MDDAVPAGAMTYTDADVWSWVTSNPAPASGARSHKSQTVGGMHQHLFDGANPPLAIQSGDTIYAYVYLDPAAKPPELMLQFNTSPTNGWNARACCTENLIPSTQPA